MFNQHNPRSAIRRLAAALIGFVAMSLTVAIAATPAAAKPVTPQPGQGWISLVGHTCGSSAGWQAIARANGSGSNTTPAWLLPSRQVNVNCPARVEPKSSPKPKASPLWVRPVAGGWSAGTGCFGAPRKRANGTYYPHAGADISLPGGRPIYAAAAGRVVESDWWSGGYGISVVIDHGNGLYTHSAHMSRDVVSNGQRVKRGQVIGYVGRTGHATGDHLHFEVWKGWKVRIDPTAFLRKQGVKMGCST